MSAETLRRTAALMRERAEAATPDWFLAGNKTLRGGTRTLARFNGREDAQHAASWHPAVALAAADLLDDAAEALDLNTPTGEAALVLARAYLGETS